MLLELAIGDALGAGFEYAPDTTVIAHNTADHYVPHPKHEMTPGVYTDDTQMSLAIAEALISGEEWLPGMLADRYVLVFKRDPRLGYARRFYALLQEVTTGAELLDKLLGNASDRSGAAMRACPLGVLPNIGDILSKCRIQAAITHNSSDGINAALASSLLAHYCLYELGPKAEAGKFIERFVDGAWATPWEGPVGEKGWHSVRAAITALSLSNSMTELLKCSIAFTGDVDTVATIAMAAAAHCKEIKYDIPEILLNGLENGTFGRDYLIDLDSQLMRLKG
jgi:ADP-ribosylglycohydrolase